jgi:uncharacterized phage infection (PIP) family protein YhgE
MRWVIGIVVVAVLVVLGYQYFGPGSEQIAEQAEQPAEPATETAEPAETTEPEPAEQAAETAEQATEEAAEATGEAADTAEEAAETAEQATEEAAQATGEAAETAEQAADTAEQATGEAAEATGEAAETAEQAADTAETAEQATGEAAEELAQSSAALVVGDIDLGKELTGVVDRTSAALSGITDAASAEAALPALNEARTKLDDLTPTVEQLPDNAKETLAGAVSGMLPELRTLVDKVNGMEGAGEVVKPAVEPIMAKLDAWAKQPA